MANERKLLCDETERWENNKCHCNYQNIRIIYVFHWHIQLCAKPSNTTTATRTTTKICWPFLMDEQEEAACSLWCPIIMMLYGLASVQDQMSFVCLEMCRRFVALLSCVSILFRCISSCHMRTSSPPTLWQRIVRVDVSVWNLIGIDVVLLLPLLLFDSAYFWIRESISPPVCVISDWNKFKCHLFAGSSEAERPTASSTRVSGKWNEGKKVFQLHRIKCNDMAGLCDDMASVTTFAFE